MKLFVSFTTLLGAIAGNAVSQEDLDTGLFYFGCVRSHAFTPGAEAEFDERVSLKERGAPAHEKLIAALTKAEAEGRCRWHRPDNHTRLAPYTLLNELLEANGIEKLKFVQEDFEPGHYCYPAVRDMMAQIQGPRAEVLF